VPAAASSLIRPVLAQPSAVASLHPVECPDLLQRLAQVPDPRDRRGLRHPLAGVLALATAAVLTGARSLAAITEWAADAPPLVLAALGVRRDPLTGEHRVPGETTLRRVLTTIDGDALDAAVTAWLADRLPAPGPRQPRATAVDGKTLRGATQPGGRPVHLLAALDHATGAVLAQHQVDGAPEEVTGFQPLLAGLDLTGVTVTADALHTKRDAAKFLVTDKHAHYLLTVKANQPTLHAQLRQLPWQTSRCCTAVATAAMAGSRPAASRSSPWLALASRTHARQCRSLAASATSTAAAGAPWSSTRSPT
jgi:predicted transposase YbfD/YdcC